jgi:hypothetical protein
LKTSSRGASKTREITNGSVLGFSVALIIRLSLRLA